MTDDMTNNNTHGGRTTPDPADPDSLMHAFRGRGIVAILVFTILVHAVLIGGTSFTYLKDRLFGPDTDSMTRAERVDAAVREATSALREIAEKHGLQPQDITEKFARTGAAASTGRKPSTPAPKPGDATEPPRAPSEIEKTLRKVEAGPDLPDLPGLPDPTTRPGLKNEEPLF